MQEGRWDEELDEAVRLVERAAGVTWFDTEGNAVDVAVASLCRLRRAMAGDRGAAEAGDKAVREALKQADPQALVWLASRTISYMDEHEFPELVAGWLRRVQ